MSNLSLTALNTRQEIHTTVMKRSIDSTQQIFDKVLDMIDDNLKVTQIQNQRAIHRVSQATHSYMGRIIDSIA